MTPQIKTAHGNLQTERELVSPCFWAFNQMFILCNWHRQRRLVKPVQALAVAIVIAMFVATSASAQEQQHAYSE